MTFMPSLLVMLRAKSADCCLLFAKFALSDWKSASRATDPSIQSNSTPFYHWFSAPMTRYKVLFRFISKLVIMATAKTLTTGRLITQFACFLGMMKLGVSRFTWKQFKIFNPVVILHRILVVHNLRAKQSPSKMFCHQHSMLQNITVFMSVWMFRHEYRPVTFILGPERSSFFGHGLWYEFQGSKAMENGGIFYG